jgi:Skp family chaperone for outer membrane proteins
MSNMIRRLAFASIAFVVPALLLAPQPSHAAPAAGTPVAIIDIGHVFKNHPGFKSAREALMQKGKDLQATVAQQRKQLTAENEKLKQFQIGSPEFKKLEAQLAQTTSDYQVQNQLKQKTLLEEEARLHYETYEEVLLAVKAICERNGIQLVLRYDRDKMDPAEPESIRRGILNNIVYQNRLDITDLVLNMAVAAKPAPNSRK